MQFQKVSADENLWIPAFAGMTALLADFFKRSTMGIQSLAAILSVKGNVAPGIFFSQERQEHALALIVRYKAA
jgi:hypothetical protein